MNLKNMAYFFEKKESLLLSEIIKAIDATVEKNIKDFSIINIAPLHLAKEGDLSFFHNPKYIDDLKQTKASVVLVSQKYADAVPKTCLAVFTEKPYRDFGKITMLFYPRQKPKSDISPLAFIHHTAQIGENVTIEPFVVVKENAIIGDCSIIKSHTVIGEKVKIGNGAYIEEHVTIQCALIDENVFIKSGARIGQAGFGFHMDEKGHFDIPQLGAVRIGKNVQIGSNTTIDRGSQLDTIIHDGVRIDNLVQIAHNVEIGANSVLVAQVGVAGSTTLGKFVIAAGQAGIAGHLKIGDFVKIAGQTGVMRNVENNETIAGTPAQNAIDWHKQTVVLKKMIKK